MAKHTPQVEDHPLDASPQKRLAVGISTLIALGLIGGLGYWVTQDTRSLNSSETLLVESVTQTAMPGAVPADDFADDVEDQRVDTEEQVTMVGEVYGQEEVTNVGNAVVVTLPDNTEDRGYVRLEWQFDVVDPYQCATVESAIISELGALALETSKAFPDATLAEECGAMFAGKLGSTDVPVMLGGTDSGSGPNSTYSNLDGDTNAKTIYARWMSMVVGILHRDSVTILLKAEARYDTSPDAFNF